MELKIIQKEYFELIIKLNKSNKIKNEKTKLGFQVIRSEAEQVAYLHAVLTVGGRVCLGLQKINKSWAQTGYSGFNDFEEYVIKILNENSFHQEGDYTELILEKLFPKE